MPFWIATLSNDLDESKPFKELQVEADDKTTAIAELATLSVGDEWRGYSLLNVRRKRGGYRPNAGRKKGTQGTYGCATKVVRVPEEIAPQLPELLSNIDQLRELLGDWESEAAKSTSPRYDRARKLIAEIRGLGF
jgi:hypothetical protein